MLGYIVRDNLLPLCTAAAIIAVISLAGWFMGFRVNYSIYSFPMLVLAPSLVIIPLLGLIFWTLWKDRPARPTAYIGSKFLTEWRGLERTLRGLPILLLFPVVFSVFTSYKSALGHMVPFYFDPYAMHIDQLIHGGDAWKLYAVVTAYPFVTALLNVFYNIWFFALFAVLSFCTFMVTDTRLRSQFLVAFLLCWFLIGVVFATALSSVGPCYYQYFFDDNSYGYIKQYLESVAEHYPVAALGVQKHLLDRYIDTQPGLGEGISAMPSMHVSVAAITALFLSQYGRAAALIGWSYCLIILLASVHLGWHYAIDGYLAILLTVLIWKGSGKLVTAFNGSEQGPPLIRG